MAEIPIRPSYKYFLKRSISSARAVFSQFKTGAVTSQVHLGMDNSGQWAVLPSMFNDSSR